MDQAFSNQQDFFNAGGAKDFSNVQTLAPGQTPTGQFYKYSSPTNGYNAATVFSNSQFAPPNPSTPVPSSQISNGSALHLPSGSPAPDGSSLVASAIVGNTPPPTTDGSTPATDSAIGTTDYTQDPAYQAAQQKYEQGITDYTTAVNNEPSHAGLMSDAEQAQGVPEMQNKLASINTQIAEKTAAFNTTSAQVETHGVENGVPAVFYQGEQAAVRRQQAVEIGGLSAVKAALQGNYDLAESRAKQVADLQFADAEKKIANAENFIKLNQDNLNNQEKVAVAKIKANVTTQKAQLTEQKANVTLALSNGVQSQFFTKPDGTVVRSNDGYAFSTPQEAFAAGVLPDFSNAPRIQNVGKSETKTINGRSVHITYDKSGTNVISQTDLGAAGKQKSGSTKENVSTATNLADTYIQSGIPSSNLPGVGKDGYVSPETYNKIREAWVADGHPVNTFDTRFSKYVNPANPQDYKGAKVKAPKTTSSNSSVPIK